MTEQEINDLVLVSDGYSLELTSELLSEHKKGCMGYSISTKIMQLVVLKGQLKYKISIEDYGKETQSLYSCLLGAVANYSGASISIDPNASIPGTIIVVNPDEQPYWFNAPWSDFESDDEDENGYRYTIVNPIFEKWNPEVFAYNGDTPNKRLLGVHYDIYEGGILRFRENFGVDSLGSVSFGPFAKNTPIETKLFHVIFDTTVLVWEDSDIWDDTEIWTD